MNAERRSIFASIRASGLRILVTTLLAIAALGPASADDWPQVMGVDRAGVSQEPAPKPLTESPEPIWTRQVGAGFAGPVVQGDLVVLFHRKGNQEIVEAIHRNSGRTHWRSSYATNYRDDFGFDEGPRAPATISGQRVITFGAQGRLTAFDLENGKLLWQRDTAKEFEVPKGFFGAAGSPLVIEGRVLVNIGGKDAGIAAFDLTTGEPIWQSTKDAASYSSGIAARIAHEDASETSLRAVFFTREGLAIVNTTDGNVLRSYGWRSRLRSSVNAALPLVLGDRVLLSASYGTGTVMLDTTSSPPTQLWSSKDALAAHYAPVIAKGTTLYGIHGRVEYGGELRAVDAATGTVRWSHETGAGALIAVGDTLLMLHDTGELSWVAATPNSYQPLGSVELFSSTVRALPAYSDGVLFARDETTLSAFRLGPSAD